MNYDVLPQIWNYRQQLIHQIKKYCKLITFCTNIILTKIISIWRSEAFHAYDPLKASWQNQIISFRSVCYKWTLPTRYIWYAQTATSMYAQIFTVSSNVEDKGIQVGRSVADHINSVSWPRISETGYTFALWFEQFEWSNLAGVVAGIERKEAKLFMRLTLNFGNIKIF